MVAQPGSGYTATEPAVRLWRTIFPQDNPRTLLCIARIKDEDRDTWKHEYFRYPHKAEDAAKYALEWDAKGWDVYFCAHLLTASRRIKENAADMLACYVDSDGANLPKDKPTPTALVESSPGKFHGYWGLTSPLDPSEAERINHAIAYSMGADKSGWDLSQVLRVPGTHNHKPEYATPEVSLITCNGHRYSPSELLEAFPPPEPNGQNGERSTESDEPPIALTPEQLKWWTGEKAKYTSDGEIDRSATLLMIGRCLFDAGANRPVIVAALADRDVALGYDKYTDRRDADDQYHRIVDELEKTGRNTRNQDSSTADTELIPKATPFPLKVLPKAIRHYVREAAKAIGCPVEFIALPVMASCAAAIGNAYVIRIKRRWKEPATFWFLLIGYPSTKKSPALQEGIFPLIDEELKLKDQYNSYLEEHAAEMRQYRKDVKEARSKNREEPPEPKKKTQKRVLVNDTTTEAVVRILSENWRGVLLSRDELAGWVRGMDQYKQGGRGSDRQFWLQTWSASYSSTDRKGAEGTLYVKEPSVSIIGGIQPAILPELGKDRNDGFFDRILPAYPTTTPQMWTEDDVSADAEEAYKKLVENLRDKIIPPKDRETDKEFSGEIGFSTEARKLWAEATDALKKESMQPGFPERLQGPWGKLEAYLARFSLLFALIRVASDDSDDKLQKIIQPRSLKAALRVIGYFKNHIRRVYVQLYGVNSDDATAANLSHFLHKNGGQWEGLVNDLYELLPQPKPDRPNELGRLIRKFAQRYSALEVKEKHTNRGTYLQIVVTVVTPSPSEEDFPEEESIIPDEEGETI